ncbi:MAG: glutaminyl-peptide cyclotransferase [Chitinophagaceae bacterium]
MKKILSLFSLLAFLTACNNTDNPKPDNPGNISGTKSISYSVLNTYPHDTSSFTEGILIYKGDLYESTGDYGKSRLLKTDLKTGKALQSLSLDPKYFGEGIVIVNDTIYQLTYKENVGFMYSLKDFKKIKEFKFAAKEGWGMTTDGKQIIASDGTSALYFYEPSTFRLLRTQDITEDGTPVSNVNELEYIDGYIYSNQWQYPYILKIDPANGNVVGKADLSKITETIKAKYPYADVLNGIAYDSATKKMYVTGKKWPELYEIQFSQ